MHSFPPGYEINPATWFYLSLVLIIAVFFRFNRVWSLRNFDLGLLLAAPAGLLLVEERTTASLGYSWLFAVTGVFLMRLLADPLLRRRPHLGQNMNAQGSAFLCVAAALLLATQALQHQPSASTADALARAEDLVKGQDRPVEAASAESNGEATSGPIAPILYAPLGLLIEVEETAARVMSLVAHLAVILGLLYVGRNLYGDLQLGLAMATLYLLLPCTAYDVSEVNHVLPAAFTVWAVVAYRRPMVSGILLGLACGIMFFPLFLLPVWAAFYGRRGALRFGMALLLVAAVVVSVVALTSTGPESFVRKTIGTIPLTEILSVKSDKLDLPNVETGFWTPDLWYYRAPVIATFFLLLAGMTIWPRRKQLEHLTAYSAAIIVAIQFWYPVQGGVYLLWYLPLLLVVVFRPRLIHVQPQEGAPEADAAKRATSPAGPHSTRGATNIERFHLFR